MEAKPEGFELRLALLFGALMSPNAVYLAFFPVWLHSRGYSSVQVGILLSAAVLMRIVATPPTTYFADRSPERANVMIVIAGLAFALSAAFFVKLPFSALLIIICLLAAAWSPQVPLADSIALSGLRRFGTDYASMRIWGSITFLGVSIAAGRAVELYGPSAVPSMLCFGFFLIFLASLAMPRLGRRRQIIDAGPIHIPNLALRRPAVITFLLASGLIQASHGFLYAFGSIYWQASGVSAESTGILWAASVFSEIVLFKFYKRLLGHYRPEKVLLICGSICALRWLLMPYAGGDGLGIFGFLALQMTHSFTFGATYLAQQAYLAHAVPEEKSGSAQGLAVFVHGIAMCCVTFASGPIYDLLRERGFILMAFLAVAGVVFGYWFARLNALEAQPQRAGEGG